MSVKTFANCTHLVFWQWLMKGHTFKKPRLICINILVVIICFAMGQLSYAQSLNPTGRDIRISMPIFADELQIGEVIMQLSKDDSIALDARRFIQIAMPYINENHFSELESFAESKALFTKTFLESFGYTLLYNPSLLQLTLTWPSKLKSIRHLDGKPKSASYKSLAEPPSSNSAYLNIFAGANWTEQYEHKNQNNSLALNGATSFPSLHHLTIESEARYHQQERKLKRQGTRIVLDQPEQNRRWQAGDITSSSLGYLGSSKMLGISLSRNFNIFQRDRQLARPTGRTSFFLERTSIVRILVNDTVKSERRLPEGPYELDQFPISYGSNRVVVEIEDDTGITERLVFNIFSNSQFLAPGESELSFSTGVERELVNEENHYSSKPVFSGFYRRGATQSLTFSTYASVSKDINLAGIGSQIAVPYGRLSLESAASKARNAKTTEHALNAGWSLLLPKASASRSKRLFVGAGYSSRLFNQLPSSDSDSRKSDAIIDYSQSINRFWSIGLSHKKNRYHNRLGNSVSSARLNYDYRDLSFKLELDHDHTESGNSKDQLTIRASYRFDQHNSIASSATSDEQYTSSYHLNSNRQGVGQWQLALDTSKNKDDNLDAGLSASYDANRAQLSASHRRDIASSDNTNISHSNVSLGTALAYAGGEFAIGRPIRDSFVIFSTHENLRDKTTPINQSQRENYGASNGFLGPALYSEISSYTDQTISYDVDDLPLGYNLGKGLVNVFPSYRSGYQEVIGNSATVTVIGNLLDENGSPAKLLTGVATPISAETESEKTVFTNSAGRFAAQGLSPGSWKIILFRKSTPLSYFLVIPKNTVGLHRSGKLSPDTQINHLEETRRQSHDF